MPQITDITMKNLRGLQHLTLEDTRIFNVVVGPSEIGKTTVLEGIFIASGMVDLHGMARVNQYRKAKFSDFSRFNMAMHSLFADWGDDPISIGVAVRDPNTVKYKYIAHLNKKFSDENTIAFSDNRKYTDYDEKELTGVEAKISMSGDIAGRLLKILTFKGDDDESAVITHVKTDVIEELIHSDPCNATKNPVNSEQIKRFVPRSILQVDESVENAVTSAENAMQKGAILPVIQHINPRIKDFAMVGKEVRLGLNGLNFMKSIHTSGGGVKEIITTLGNLTHPAANILLIDEIGRNLHHSAMPGFLRAVLQFARDQNKQIFATTHNKDVLVALQQIAEQEAALQNDIKCYSMVRNLENQAVACPFTYEGLAHCIENDIEIR